MKLLLVNTNIERSPYPIPPAGLCMIASFLKDEYDVKVYDGVFDEGRSLPQTVKDFSPDFIGFSIRNIDDVVFQRPVYFIDRIISDFIDPVKKITSVPVILGGSGFNMFPEELMELTRADYGITGDGETGLAYLLNCFKNDDLPPRHSILRPPYPEIKKITGSSEIDLYLDFGPYRQRGVYSVQTKRGCAHQCIYCSYPVIEGHKFRTRNAEEIVDEIENAKHRLGEITFEFVDSTFNDPAGHAEKICSEIIRRGLKVRMRTMGINPRNCLDELFFMMKEAGFIQIDATPDTASPAMLKNLQKGFSLDDIRKMAVSIRKADLPSMWFFLFGGPGENQETFKETIDFIDDYVNPDDLVYLNYGLRIYPGTPLYQIALKEGKISKTQNLLYPSPYYFPDEPVRTKISELILEATETRTNCLAATDTKPPDEMLREAVKLREEEGLNEVMFRTLLKIRRKWKSEGRL